VQEVAVEPAAPGLDLICRGIRATSPDDLTALQRGAITYEALYAQLSSDLQLERQETPRRGEAR